MPRLVSVYPPMGPATFNCYISTPESHDATSIIPGIPTILFLHPVFIPSQIFECQWADPALRQFNLVAFDMRVHGRTLGRWPKSGPMNVMEDVRHVMDALDLPPCHIFAMASNCDVALELALHYPQRVLSLVLCSPLPRYEDEEIKATRRDIIIRWIESFSFPLSSNRGGYKVIINQATVNEAIVGMKQFAFNMEKSPILQALADCTLEEGINHITPELLEDYYGVVVRWAEERQRITRSEMEKVKSPLLLIYFNDDIVCRLESTEELGQELHDAGVDVSLLTADGPHLGCIQSAFEINRPVKEFIESYYRGQPITSVPITADRVRKDKMRTPFQDMFIRCGYNPQED